MKKNHLLVLASVMLSALNAQAHTSTVSWDYHDARFANKTFRLHLPLKNQCMELGGEQADPTTLVSASCDQNDEYWANHRLQFVDGSIRTMKSFNGEQKCLTFSSAASPVYFSSCDDSNAQQFKIGRFTLSNPHFSMIEDRFVIQSVVTSKCLYNRSLGRETLSYSCSNAANSDENYLFELADVTDPVKVRLVNRGWYNMTFVTTYASEEWKPSWLALDGIRERFLPTYAHTGVGTSPLNIRTDFKSSITFDAQPGDGFEAISHGTAIKKWTNAEQLSSTAQLKIYSGYDYSSPNGSRFISDSTPNLMNFNDSIQSYEIPEGWSVRFYEQPNYQGGYYTRSSSSAQDSHVDMNIKSIKILRKS